MIDFFFSRRKPRFRSADPEVRLRAVAEDHLDDDTLASLAREDTVLAVRRAAVAAITSPELLETLAKNSPPELSAEAKRRAWARRTELVIGGEASFEEKLAILEKIEDDDLLQRIACEAVDSQLRLRGAERIKGQDALAAIGGQQCGKQVASLVVSRIGEPELLNRLATSGGSRFIRRLAAAKLAGGSAPAVDGKEVEAALQDLLDNGRRLATDRNFALAASRFAELQREWTELDPNRSSPLYPGLCEAMTTFEERRRRHAEQEASRRIHAEKQQALRDEVERILAGMQKEPLPPEVLHQQEASIMAIVNQLDSQDSARYHRRLHDARILQQDYAACVAKEQPLYDRLIRETEGLAELAENDPKAAATALRRFRRQLGKHPFQALDATVIETRLADAEERLREQRRLADEAKLQNLHEIVAAIDSLTTDFQDLLAMEDKRAAADRFRELQTRYEAMDLVDDPGVHASLDRCKKTRRKFLAGQREFFSEQDWLFWSSRTIKEDLIDEVAALAASDDYELILAKVKDAQRRWKESGHTPNAGRLWHEFHGLCQQQYNRCLPFLEEKKARRAELLREKEELVAKAEALSQAERFKEASREMTAVGERLRAIGVLGGKEDRDLMARYHRAANQFFERRRVHFAEIDRMRRENLQKKEQLCLQMEQLTATPTWEIGKEVAELQKRWKKIGPAPQEHNDVVWHRFQQAADRYYGWIDSRRLENLAAKRALVQEAAAIAAAAPGSEDLRECTEKIKNIQTRWKGIGPVPREQENGIWQEFRRHCDLFFGVKLARYSRQQEEYLANQRAKEEIIEKLEALAGHIDDHGVTESVKDLQKRYQELGPAPREVEKVLRERLQRLCDGFFEGRKKHFTAIREENEALLKEKEALVFEMEKLAGISPSQSGASGPKTLSLAEQLKLAIESNTLLGSGDRESARRDEARRIKKQWAALPPLAWKVEDRLQQRFQRAAAILEPSKPKA